jgi:hypothetical protein
MSTPPGKVFLSTVASANRRQRRRHSGGVPAFQIARVTDNRDPKKLRRIKVQFEWGRSEEGGPIIESAWIHKIQPHGGPTAKKRGRRWGHDGPLPEVGQRVAVLFNNNDPADGRWFGVDVYGEGETEVPGTEKDDAIDWSWRDSYANGFEQGCSAEGDYYLHVPGNAHIKVDCNMTLEVGGQFIIICTYLSFIVLALLRMFAQTIDMSDYLRPEERAEVEKLQMEAMRPGGRTRKDPGIGKINDLKD